ncbi:hypothetical protein J6590_032055 [Homalodisca vitripennis]|nr:hypothetical protein J6590_032055 [Homalodisca vitripennis]
MKRNSQSIWRQGKTQSTCCGINTTTDWKISGCNANIEQRAQMAGTGQVLRPSQAGLNGVNNQITWGHQDCSEMCQGPTTDYTLASSDLAKPVLTAKIFRQNIVKLLTSFLIERTPPTRKMQSRVYNAPSTAVQLAALCNEIVSRLTLVEVIEGNTRVLLGTQNASQRHPLGLL